MSIGKKLKRITHDKHISIKELAEKSGVSCNTLYAIIKRDNDTVKPVIASAIAKALDISVDKLVCDYELTDTPNVNKGLNKLNTIADLLDGKGSILVRTASHDYKPNSWFVHCHWNWSSLDQSEVTEDERIKRVIFKGYVTNLEATLDEIIEKLGGKK